jgi:hypothetical protein
LNWFEAAPPLPQQIRASHDLGLICSFQVLGGGRRVAVGGGRAPCCSPHVQLEKKLEDIIPTLSEQRKKKKIKN